MKPVSLCGECYLQGFCRKLESKLVHDVELTPEFIRSVRDHMRSLNVSASQWGWFLIDAYRDYPGLIIDPKSGCTVELDTHGFDDRDMRYWFRDLLEPVPQNVTPRVRREAKNRFKVMATILRAVDPVNAMLWGKTVANDEMVSFRPSIRLGGDACPYQHFQYFDAVKFWGGGEQ